MFGNIGYTWAAMGALWDVVRRTRRLLVFPLLSSICCLVVVASFLVPIAMNGAWRPPANNADVAHKVIYYGTLFAFYFCNYAVITYFNVALVAGAVSRMIGNEPTIGFCLSEANRRLHLILGWAAVSATVGLVLRVIEDRSPKVGQIVAGLLGSVWSLVSFLVVPAMVVDNKGPIDALKESGRLLRQTWGEHLVGNFCFGLMFVVLAIPGILMLGLAFYAFAGANNIGLAIACGALGAAYMIGLGLVQSALQSVFQAAIFLNARGIVSHGFSPELLSGAIRAR